MSNSKNAMPTMTFGKAVKTCFREYATFSGRASRAEFWWFTLLYFVLLLIPFINGIALVALSIPMLAVTWRRLHDSGKSGLWCLAPIVPVTLVGYLSLYGCSWLAEWWSLLIFKILGATASITLLVFLVTKGDTFTNGYDKHKNSFIESIKSCFRKYATFRGRASRTEFWSFYFLLLVNAFLLGASWGVFEGLVTALEPIEYTLYPVLLLLFGIYFSFGTVWSAMVIPMLAVTWRRMHDIGKSGGWFFIRLLPFIGSLILLIMALLPGDNGANRFGKQPDPICE